MPQPASLRHKRGTANTAVPQYAGTCVRYDFVPRCVCDEDLNDLIIAMVGQWMGCLQQVGPGSLSHLLAVFGKLLAMRRCAASFKCDAIVWC